jgi:multidrug efflux pump subunit AcrA (membrane-fusion protein)
VVPVGEAQRAAEATLLGPAPSVDTQMQGQGWLFLLTPNGLRLAPGAAVVGQLRLPGEPLTGVIVPSSAVVRVEGKACVYVQKDKRTFNRRTVTAARPVEDGWFVSSGLAPKDQVVVVGAQALLSEEFRSQIKMLE